METSVKVLNTWSHLKFDNLLFPHFYQSLCNEEPWLTREPLALLQSLGTPQFAARIKFPVSLASQLGHILSPNHLVLHRMSLLGIKRQAKYSLILEVFVYYKKRRSRSPF